MADEPIDSLLQRYASLRKQRGELRARLSEAGSIYAEIGKALTNKSQPPLLVVSNSDVPVPEGVTVWVEPGHVDYSRWLDKTQLAELLTNYYGCERDCRAAYQAIPEAERPAVMPP